MALDPFLAFDFDFSYGRRSIDSLPPAGNLCELKQKNTCGCRMRILFALPGLHRHDRGAEIAFISIASELARGGDNVTLIGSGQERQNTPYSYLRAASIRREKFESFPCIPLFRNECVYEELTFIPHF